jgi:uncharacterized membrane protein
MGTSRIEAFSDGVIAVIITITVLNLQPPRDAVPTHLLGQLPLLLTYVLSFVVVGILWINHHHLMHLAKHATPAILWANNLLLFWMSLVPFTTAYMGNNHGAPLSVAVYGAVMMFVGLSFTLLRWTVSERPDNDPDFAIVNRHAIRKSLLSAALYAFSIPMAYVNSKISIGIFVLIPAAYFLPERKIAEHAMKEQK